MIELYLGINGSDPLMSAPRLVTPIRTFGSAYLVAGQYDAAATALRERIRLTPKTDLSRAFLASALGHLGESAEARRVWHELRDINPRYSFEEHWARLPFQNQADGERIREGLAKAQLPD